MHRQTYNPPSAARPFLRWAGGKQWLAPVITRILPEEARTYFEPFLGGASIFLAIRPKRAFLADRNFRLIETYGAVRDNPRRVLHWLSQWPNSRRSYLDIRSSRFSGVAQRAAQFIYLNKTCWNGLYRVGKSGVFNVPYCNDPRRRTHDPHAILRASRLLESAELRCCDFEDLLVKARPGDFVYLDPPYTVLHTQNGFRRYNEELFTWDDQKRLANIALRLANSGCFVVVSNALHDDLLRLYPQFVCHVLPRNSRLAADPRFRRAVQEALLFSPNLPRLELL